MDVRFTDNSKEVLAKKAGTLAKALEQCGLLGENYAKKNCSVDTGALRNSISHKVVLSEEAAYIGTNQEYGPYVELGTGIYISGGRPTPWVYQDANGNWHMTHGQRAQPYLKPAVADHASQYRVILEDALKNG